MKGKITVLVSTLMTLTMLSNVMADSSISVPIKMDSTVTGTVAGYIAEVEYNPDVLSPVLTEPDVLGESCYAKNAMGAGYLTADKPEDGKIVVGWADAEEHKLNADGILSNIEFSIFADAVADIKNDDGEFSNINVKIYQIAKYPDVMYNSEYAYTEKYQLKTGNSITVSDEVESGGAAVPDEVTSNAAVFTE